MADDDRKLLEDAARAAGLEMDTTRRDRPLILDADGRQHDWDPLDDDGDALRLAVALEFCTGLIRRPKLGEFYAVAGRYGEYREDVGSGDPCAATRRAIVRAAAAMGRG